MTDIGVLLLKHADPGHRQRVMGFFRRYHHEHSHDGVSYAGIVALPADRVLLLSGPSDDALTNYITEHCTDAEAYEVLRLENLQ